jgi:zinc transport system permease protein
MGIGSILLEIFIPVSELLLPIIPGETFPYFFGKQINGNPVEIFQRSLFATIIITFTACLLGPFLMMRNLSLIGDGLAHVSFGGVAIGLVVGAADPLWYALSFSILAAILIYELQSREILTGDASIAIFLTGFLALGLVILQIWGGGITSDIHGYLFGNILLISESNLEMISVICVISIILLYSMRHGLLASSIDPIAARIQGIPIRQFGLLFSIITAAVVVSMVKVVGALLVTALLVTPAATGRLVGGSFRSCMIWTQFFGFISVIVGLYLSSEMDTGNGAMIALVAAIFFAIVGLIKSTITIIIKPNQN